MKIGKLPHGHIWNTLLFLQQSKPIKTQNDSNNAKTTCQGYAGDLQHRNMFRVCVCVCVLLVVSVFLAYWFLCSRSLISVRAGRLNNSRWRFWRGLCLIHGPSLVAFNFEPTCE